MCLWLVQHVLALCIHHQGHQVFFSARGAPRRASSSIFALMDCRKAVTLSEPLVISLSWLLACLMWPREGLA